MIVLAKGAAVTSPTELSTRLVDALQAAYGAHRGHRAAHAKGVLCAASFTASPAASALSRAPHFAGESLPAHVRFSNGSGDPLSPDAARDARGMALKIYLPGGGTTDIVALSLPSFFARTPEDLIAFNQARRVDPATGAPDTALVGTYLSEHPEAIPAVTAAITHPLPVSYAALGYHALHAFGLEADDGSVRFGRYHLVPDAGTLSLTDEEAAERDHDYLRSELAVRLAAGPARFVLDFELAGAGDPIDDPTAQWPADREMVRLGEVAITALAHDRETGGDVLVFDPTRVPDGVQLSDDPILHARPGAYSVSVARRT
jgi:catalase